MMVTYGAFPDGGSCSLALSALRGFRRRLRSLLRIYGLVPLLEHGQGHTSPGSRQLLRRLQGLRNARCCAHSSALRRTEFRRGGATPPWAVAPIATTASPNFGDPSFRRPVARSSPLAAAARSRPADALRFLPSLLVSGSRIYTLCEDARSTKQPSPFHFALRLVQTFFYRPLPLSLAP